MTAWIWIAIGVVLGALEMVLPGVYLLWIGVGAVAAGGVLFVFPALSLTAQLTTFALFAVAAAIFGYWIYRRGRTSDRPTLNRRGEDLVGRDVVITEPIRNGIGHVEIDGLPWRVRGPDAAAGTRMRVDAVDGSTLELVALR